MTDENIVALLTPICSESTHTPYIDNVCEFLTIAYKKGNPIIISTEYVTLSAFRLLDLDSPALSKYAYKAGEYRCISIQPMCPIYGNVTIGIFPDGKVMARYYTPAMHPCIREDAVMAEFKRISTCALERIGVFTK